MSFSLLMFLTCNSVKKRLQGRCLSVNFTKFLRIFFIRFNVFFYFYFYFIFLFFLQTRKLIETRVFYFQHVLSWWISWSLHLENLLCKTNNPVVAAWDHTEHHVELSGVFLRLINWSTLTFIHYELTFIYYEFLHSIAL